MDKFRTALSVALAATCAACSPAPSPAPLDDTARIRAADTEPGNWLTHGRTYSEQRFSPLTKVNTGNVGQLGLAWSYELKTNRGASATPLVVDGVMYVTSAWSVVHALDAKTGREIWVFDPQVKREAGAHACCDAVNRGVAIYGGKVFVGALDGRLVALDAAGGTKIWDVVTVDQSQPYTITGAPRAANGLVYIGNGGAEYGVRGYVSAYDVNTGGLKWRFYTVPGDPSKGPDGAASDPIMAKAAATWNGEWWTLGGGGTVWDAIVYDPDFDQLIVGVGNGSPWNREVRSKGGGDNWFLSSIVGLDAKTGAYKWHYQTTPGDTWDFTATQPIVLADLNVDGQPRKVAMQVPKNGFFYVVDRSNGTLISAAPVVPMFTTKDTPAGMPLSWASGVDASTGRPIENPEARYLAGTAIIRPSPFGAHNWHPMSFSPETGLVYVPVQELALDFTTDAAYKPSRGRFNTATTHAPFPEDPNVLAAIKAASKGYLIAWDPVRQREAWKVEHRSPWNGGTLATAGGLVFQGTLDGRFAAYDAKAGRRVWELDTLVPTLAGPIAYEIDGEQYVAVLSGYGSAFFMFISALAPTEPLPVNGRVYAYKLGGNGTPPPITLRAKEMPKPPAIAASAKDVERGGALYGQWCYTCHGISAVAGVISDLRKSGSLHDAAQWRDIVLGGTLTGVGMPRFSEALTADEVENIRAYVGRQATLAYAQQRVADVTPPSRVR